MPTKTKVQKVRRPGSPPRKNSLLRRIEAGIGDELSPTLIHSGDPRARQLAETLLDPAYRHHSFGKLCERAGISGREVVDLFRKYKIDEGIVRMAQHLPDVLEDAAIDAKSSMGCCRRCDGLGSVPLTEGGDRECPLCFGTGQVRIPGDKDARALVFKANELTGRGSLVSIQTNVVPQQFDFVRIVREAQEIIDIPRSGDQNTDAPARD